MGHFCENCSNFDGTLCHQDTSFINNPNSKKPLFYCNTDLSAFVTRKKVLRRICFEKQQPSGIVRCYTCKQRIHCNSENGEKVCNVQQNDDIWSGQGSVVVKRVGTEDGKTLVDIALVVGETVFRFDRLKCEISRLLAN